MDDEELTQFYQRGKTAAVLGDQAFMSWTRESQLREVDDKVIVEHLLPGKLSMDHLIGLVGAYYKVDTTVLTTVVKGPKKGLLARKVAMYVCQQLGGFRLADIMRTFELSNRGSVSFITTQIRKRCQENPGFAHTMQRIKRYIIKHAS